MCGLAALLDVATTPMEAIGRQGSSTVERRFAASGAAQSFLDAWDGLVADQQDPTKRAFAELSASACGTGSAQGRTDA